MESARSRSLQLRGTVEAFLENPVGSCLVGECWLYFCAAPTLYGITFWGRPDAESTQRLIHALVGELREPIAPHTSFVDARGVDSIDGQAFSLLSDYVQTHHEALTRKVTRLALVRPAGLPGAVAAGFYEVLESPYPARVFAEPEEALRWLEWPEASALLADLDAQRSEVSGRSALVSRLRAMIESNLLEIDLPGAAKGLSVSPRTLQRRLAEQETHFAALVAAVRIETAMRLLRDTDETLTAIAHEVGCASAQHFSSLFREHTGSSPSEWRARQRAVG